MRDGLSNINGGVEKRRTEEEGGNEPSSPGHKKPERAMSEYKDNERTSECLIHILPSFVICFFFFCGLQVHSLAPTPNPSDRMSKVTQHP